MIQELIERLKAKKEGAMASAWGTYRVLLRKSVDGKPTEAELRQLEAAIEAIGRSPQQVEEDALAMTRHVAYSKQIASMAGVEEEAEALEKIRAELTAAARAFDEQQQPRWLQYHGAREACEAKLAALRGAQSNRQAIEDNEPLLFTEAA